MYKVEYTKALLKQRTKNRIRKQLIPTLIFLLLCCAIFSEWDIAKIFEKTVDTYKFGYWFTIVSVEYFFCFAPLIYYFSKKNIKLNHANCILISLAIIISAIYVLFSRHIFSPRFYLLPLFSIPLVLKYAPYFILGILFRANIKELKWVLTGMPIMIISVLIFLACQIPIGGDSYLFENCKEIIAGLSSVVFINAATFHIYKIPVVSSCKVSAILQRIGTKTLDIYLLHYFIMYAFGKTYITQRLEPFINSVYEFPVFMTVSIMIVVMCLCTVFILKKTSLYSPLFKLALH